MPNNSNIEPPKQLTLFPRDQSETWRWSDEDSCFRCTRRIYDTEVGCEVCKITRKPVKPWWAPCENFDRWLQGFGE